MTRDDTIKILSILKVSYPNFYKDMTKKDMYSTIEIWTEMFEPDDVNVVKIAVKELIQTLKFPPTIADIKQKIYDLTTEETLPTELWEKLKIAISNSLYNSEEEFEKLPDECKKFIRNPRQLKELGQMPSETIDSVTQRTIFKTNRNYQKKRKTRKANVTRSTKIKRNVTFYWTRRKWTFKLTKGEKICK